MIKGPAQSHHLMSASTRGSNWRWSSDTKRRTPLDLSTPSFTCWMFCLERVFIRQEPLTIVLAISKARIAIRPSFLPEKVSLLLMFAVFEVDTLPKIGPKPICGLREVAVHLLGKMLIRNSCRMRRSHVENNSCNVCILSKYATNRKG